MQKKSNIVGIILIALVLLLPVGTIAAALFGYSFELRNYPIQAGLTALTAITASILTSLACGSLAKPLKVLFCLFFPISMVISSVYILKCCNIWVAISMTIVIFCFGYLSLRFGQPLVLKIFAWSLSVVMILPVGFILFIGLVFGSIGQNTVVQTVESPDGNHYAQVIDSDQGALGGDTLVVVHENSGIRTFLIEITKKPQRVYIGPWGEYMGMSIWWKNENCLVVNGTEYIID